METIQKPSWNTLWYLVAIPGGDLLIEAQRLQQVLATSYNLYTGTPPPLHITICTIRPVAKERIPYINNIIETTLDAHDPIRVTAEDYQCFFAQHNSLVLKLKENQALSKLQKNLIGNLTEINVLEPSPIKEWIFHITLISQLFAKTHITQREFQNICSRLSLTNRKISGNLVKIELWRPSLEENQRVISSFPLQPTL
ncbi:hypothetical protein GGQ84_000770 [Desulfitispora alkaliphila]|uniref:2'-5' RNA ligase family protein n=1 Tax=Desulfitispora alkaliphila TaxID=622674 RepID=UPI003D254C7F